MTDIKKIREKIEDGSISSDDLPELLDVYVEIANKSEELKDEIEDWNIKFQLDLGSTVWLRSDDGVLSWGKGTIEEPDCTLIIAPDKGAALLSGELDGTTAYMAGDLQVQGSLSDAQKFATIIEIIRDELEDMD
ncbi:MAG: SCP2 sterol-binding domain-containing protein [Promethearchaeota archaeon]